MSTALKTVFPDIKLESQHLADTIRKHIYETKKLDRINTQQASTVLEKHSGVSHSPSEFLDTMIEAAGRLSIDEEGHSCEYHGDFAGVAFLQQIDERCSQLLGVNRPKREPFVKTLLQQAFVCAIPSCKPTADPGIMFNLPPRQIAEYLTGVALRNACSLMNFIHEPSFAYLLGRVYAAKPENYSTEELAFLPLLYVTLAIGELYSSSPGEATASLNQMKG